MSIISAIDIHANAKSDLHALKEADLAALTDILVLLQEMKSCPNHSIDLMTTRGNNDLNSVEINSKEWIAARKSGNDLWRLRLLEVKENVSSPASKYRIIYGYHYQTRQLCILAVVKRDQYDYDDLTTEINKRIIRDWNEF